VLADGTSDGADVLQIGGAVLVGRGADSDELEQAVGDAFGQVGGEAQPAAVAVALDQIVEAGFVDRDFAALEHFDLARVHVHAQHVVAHLGETGTSDQPDVAGTENRDFHARFLLRITRICSCWFADERSL